SCEKLDWQLSSISQICDHFSTFLISVEDLGIEAIGPSSVPDDMDDEQWLRPICAFDGAKDFRLDDKLATDVLRTLRLADEGDKIVLPALRSLHVQGAVMRGPSRDSVESFLAQRQLSNHPVQLYYRSPQSGSESSLKQWQSMGFRTVVIGRSGLGKESLLRAIQGQERRERQRQQQEWQQQQLERQQQQLEQQQQQERRQEQRRWWLRQQRQEQQLQRQEQRLQRH
ncbi:hypothetical protein EDB89DRAFT_2181295, partial [Lactarius sanguifluus]